jgi:hypothetical protein
MSINVQHNHPELNPEENTTMADNGSLVGTRGLPQNVKSLIDEVIKTDYLHYVTVNGMFEHLNNHHSTQLSPLTDMRNGAEIKKRIRNYLENRSKKLKPNEPLLQIDSIDDTVEFCEEYSYRLPHFVELKRHTFSSQNDFMAYLGTDRGKLKKRFFLPIPNREQCVAIVGSDITDELYRGIRGSCSYTTLMGISGPCTLVTTSCHKEDVIACWMGVANL